MTLQYHMDTSHIIQAHIIIIAPQTPFSIGLNSPQKVSSATELEITYMCSV